MFSWDGRITMMAGLLLGLFLWPVAAAGQTVTAQFDISGTSTVRGWTCPVEGVMDVTPGGTSEPIPGFPNGVETVALTIQTEAITCPEAQMPAHLRDAMQSEEYPEIIYRLQEYRLKTDDVAEATGTMTILGTTNPITFDIQLVQSADGMRGVGEAELARTDYGVTPPSVWLGILNVGEIVTIKFETPLPGSE